MKVNSIIMDCSSPPLTTNSRPVEHQTSHVTHCLCAGERKPKRAKMSVTTAMPKICTLHSKTSLLSYQNQQKKALQSPPHKIKRNSNSMQFQNVPWCIMYIDVYHIHPMYFQVNSSIQFQFLGHRHQIPPRPPTASRSAVFGTHRRGPASNPFPKHSEAFSPCFCRSSISFAMTCSWLVPSCSIHFFPTSAASSAVANSLYLVISPGSISANLGIMWQQICRSDDTRSAAESLPPQ